MTKQNCTTGREEGHLSCGSPHLPVSRPPQAGAEGPRRAGGVGKAGQDPRGEHHQAAQHLRLHPAAGGVHCRAPVQGVQCAQLPRQPQERGGGGRQGNLCQGSGICRQSGTEGRYGQICLILILGPLIYEQFIQATLIVVVRHQ